MRDKYITREFLVELLDKDSYYYIEGSCPELMKYPRLLEYATNIVDSNEELEGIEVWDLESAIKVIVWLGEEVYEAKLPCNSIDFIKE